MSSCNENRVFFNSEVIDHGIYLVVFQDKGGAFGSDYYYYLTDSVCFRHFVGSCDEKGYLKFLSHQNGISINIFRKRFNKYSLDSTFYKIDDLKQKGKYER